MKRNVGVSEVCAILLLLPSQRVSPLQPQYTRPRPPRQIFAANRAAGGPEFGGEAAGILVYALNGESSRKSTPDFSTPIVEEGNIFDLVAARAAVCLYQSDIRRDAIGKAAGVQASSATNWINDASAFALQKSLDKLTLLFPEDRTGIDRDTTAGWLRWWKATPSPAIIDLSMDLQNTINATLTDASLRHVDQKRDDFLARVGCRLILLPSGSSLMCPLTEPPSSIIFGKLLYGGVTRYRLLGAHNSLRQTTQPPRRAGVRMEVKPTARDNVPAWMMYGGPDRMYDAVDMGAAAVLELIILPRGRRLTTTVSAGRTMVVAGMTWKPQSMFDFYNEDSTTSTNASSNDDTARIRGTSPTSLAGSDRNEAFTADFRSSVGGLQPQIGAIVRRVLDGRVIQPADEGDAAASATSAEASTASEATDLALLGLTPVRGLLLYGPPGCGTSKRIGGALRCERGLPCSID